MANKGKIHVGDKNTEIQLEVEDTDITNSNVTVDFNATPATTLQILVIDPDDVVKTTLTAALKTLPGTDGIIFATNSDATLFDVPGPWKFKAKVTFTTGGIFTSNPKIREVLD